MDYKDLYEKAIEGRKHHYENYNHWMNMYAIFNGALFVGLYSQLEGKPYELAILILGCIAGWFWFFSVCGFYRWIISWISVVSYYEQKLCEKNENTSRQNSNLTENDEMNQNAGNAKDVYVYRLFFDGSGKCKFSLTLKNRPFSTQKLTRNFTFLVSIVWTYLLANFISNGCISEVIKNCSLIQKTGFNVLLIVLIALAVFILTFTGLFREDLNVSHRFLVQKKDAKNPIEFDVPQDNSNANSRSK